MDVISELFSAILVGFVFSFVIGSMIVFVRDYKKFKVEETIKEINADTILIRFEPVEQAGYHTVLIFDWMKNKFIGQGDTTEDAIKFITSKFLEKNIILVDENATDHRKIGTVLRSAEKA